MLEGETYVGQVRIARWSTIGAALLTGAIYVLISYRGTSLFTALGGPATLTAEYVSQRGALYLCGIAATRLVMLAVFAVVAYRSGDTWIWKDSWSVILTVAFWTSIISIIFDFIGLYPWAWRLSNWTGSSFVDVLIRNDSVAGILAYIVTWGIMNPLLEEMLFRIGLLQIFVRTARSATAAVLLSSTLFLLVHFATDLRVMVVQWEMAVWILILGLIFGAATVGRKGSAATASAMHASRNLTEAAAVLVNRIG